MKIDLNYKFVELDGTIIPERPPEMVKNDVGKMEEKKYPPFTLRKACVNVLIMREVDPTGKQVIKELSGDEKFRRYAFAVKIHNSKELFDLDDEEIKLLKTLIGRIHPPMISGQAWLILDPHEAEEKK